MTVLCIYILQEKKTAKQETILELQSFSLPCVTHLVTWVSYHGSVPSNYLPHPLSPDSGGSWQGGLVTEESFRDIQLVDSSGRRGMNEVFVRSYHL